MKKGTFFKVVNIIAICAVFAFSFYAGNILAGVGRKGEPVKIEPGIDKDTGLPVDRLNVLLLGIDARKGEKDTRTDTMILVSIDKDTNKIAMLSIPRDTLVKIPGHGENKINSANALGGSELAVDVVEDLLGVEIPYYVKTNFDGFQDIVDTLGGVTIDVEKRMYYRDGKYSINLQKGVQRLDGQKALQYVRFRHDALGDISRTERQQKFLSALADEILRAKTIVKLPKLIPQFFDVVDTNFGIKDVFFLTRVASSMKAENIVAQTLPGTFYNYKGVSYWKANDGMTKLVLDDMFRGFTTAAVIDKPVQVPKETPKPQPKPPEPAETAPQVPVDVTIDDDNLGADRDGNEVPVPGEGTVNDPNNPNGTPTTPPTGGVINPGQTPGGTQVPGTTPNTPGTTPTTPGTSPTPGTPTTPGTTVNPPPNTGSGTTQPPSGTGTTTGTTAPGTTGTGTVLQTLPKPQPQPSAIRSSGQPYQLELEPGVS